RRRPHPRTRPYPPGRRPAGPARSSSPCSLHSPRAAEGRRLRSLRLLLWLSLLLRLLLRLLRLLELLGGALPHAERQVGEQGHAQLRDLQVARGLRPVGLGLLQQDARIGQLGLRAEPLAVADLGDGVGARGLLNRSGAGLPLRARRLELLQRGA